MVIGLAGVAGAGKDLFFDLLSEKLDCQKLSLADALKTEVATFSQDQYGIHPLTCSREQKDLIRPFLVFHGKFRRDLTKGRYWVEELNKKINKNILTNSIVIVTDIRYDDYPEDEVHWLKEELEGLLVHISMYEEVPSLCGSHTKNFKEPINDEEARNDPKLKSQADYTVQWEKAKGNKEKELKPHIDGFISWLDRKKNGLSAYQKAENTRV